MVCCLLCSYFFFVVWDFRSQRTFCTGESNTNQSISSVSIGKFSCFFFTSPVSVKTTQFKILFSFVKFVEKKRGANTYLLKSSHPQTDSVFCLNLFSKTETTQSEVFVWFLGKLIFLRTSFQNFHSKILLKTKFSNDKIIKSSTF